MVFHILLVNASFAYIRKSWGIRYGYCMVPHDCKEGIPKSKNLVHFLACSICIGGNKGLFYTNFSTHMTSSYYYQWIHWKENCEKEKEELLCEALLEWSKPHIWERKKSVLIHRILWTTVTKVVKKCTPHSKEKRHKHIWTNHQEATKFLHLHHMSNHLLH